MSFSTRRALLLVLAPLAALLLIIVPLFLVGSPGADAEQGRLCRMLLPALYPEEQGIRITASEAGQRNAVHVTFRTGKNPHDHLITCRFGGIGYSAAKRDLASVQVDGVGAAQLGADAGEQFFEIVVVRLL